MNSEDITLEYNGSQYTCALDPMSSRYTCNKDTVTTQTNYMCTDTSMGISCNPDSNNLPYLTCTSQNEKLICNESQQVEQTTMDPPVESSGNNTLFLIILIIVLVLVFAMITK